MLEKVFTTSEVHFLFSTMCFQNVTEKWQLSHERFCKTLLKQMLSCSNIQQSATPACTRDAHSFIAGPVLQPPAHVEAFNTTPLWKKTPKTSFKPLPDLVLSAAGKVTEGWYKDQCTKQKTESHPTATVPGAALQTWTRGSRAPQKFCCCICSSHTSTTHLGKSQVKTALLFLLQN